MWRTLTLGAASDACRWRQCEWAACCCRGMQNCMEGPNPLLAPSCRPEDATFNPRHCVLAIGGKYGRDSSGVDYGEYILVTPR